MRLNYTVTGSRQTQPLTLETMSYFSVEILNIYFTATGTRQIESLNTLANFEKPKIISLLEREMSMFVSQQLFLSDRVTNTPG